MVSHDDVARAWWNGEKAAGSRMFTDGTTIYSHGYHWPLAIKLSGTIKVALNTERCSQSTACHKRKVLDVIGGPFTEVVECDSSEMKQIEKKIYSEEAHAEGMDRVGLVFLPRKVQPKTMNETMEAIEHYFRHNEIKPIPRKKIRDFLEKLFAAHKI